MQRLYYFAGGLAIMIVLTFLVSSAYVRPVVPTDPGGNLDQRINITLRQIVHKLLIAQGDSSSHIPPVQQLAPGNYRLDLSQKIDYDILVPIARRELQQIGFENGYTLALLDCTSNAPTLGYNWYAGQSNELLACVEREHAQTCYNLSLQFTVPEPVQGGIPLWSWLLTLCLLLVIFLLLAPFRTLIPRKESAVETIRLSNNSSLDLSGQTLSVQGDKQELTYREAKLLAYFAARQNKVLSREEINAAVWGDEGLVVGRSLDVFVSRLRKKLKEDPQIAIMAVHGLGYKFRVE